MKKTLLFTLLLVTLTHADMPKHLHQLTAVWGDKTHVLLVDSAQHKMIGQSDWNRLFTATKTGDWLGGVMMSSGKAGYINAKGEWAIAPTFDSVKGFTEDGIARVKVGDKWGFIQRDGSWLFKPTAYKVAPFYHGLAVVTEKDDGESYYLNTQGKKAFDKTFADGACDFSASVGLACVGVGEKTPAFRVTPSKTTQEILTIQTRWGYIDTQGELVIPAIYQMADRFNTFGVARVRDDNGDWFLIDKTGKRVGNETFKFIRKFSDSGYAEAETEDFKGLIDSQGKHIWAVEYPSDEHSGLYLKDRDFYDAHGKLVIETKARWVYPFIDAQSTLIWRDEQWMLLSRDGTSTPFPKNIVAPVTDAQNFINGFETGIIGMVSDTGELHYFNRSAELLYRFAPNTTGKMALFDATNQVIWQSDTDNAPYTSLLTNDARAFVDEVAENALYATVKKLLSAEPKRFHIPNPLYSGSRDPYNFDEEISGDVYQGAVAIISEKYVGEEDYGAYEFIANVDASYYNTVRARVTQLLEKRYGKAQPSDRSDYQPAYWVVDDKRLMLDWQSDVGDGDYYHQLILTVTTPQKAEEK